MTFKTQLRATVATFAILAAGYASAADVPTLAAPPVPETCKAAVSFPAFGGVIKQNPAPYCVNTPVGDIYAGAVVTGYAYDYSPRQSDFYVSPNGRTEKESRLDISNALAIVQKTDGPLQFFVAAGLYSVPALGLPTFRAIDQTDFLYGPVPVAIGKYAINDEWSVQGGRMPTLIGTEGMFTFQRLNISAGLLFNQENLINQGVQLNYSSGPLSASVAVTDGAFSGELNWVTGAVVYKLSDTSSVGVNGGTHFSNFNSARESLKFQYATPLAIQNSSIVSAFYTYADGPWIITPWVQYTKVDRVNSFGLAGAETFGGALLASYSFTENFHLAGRGEYIEQSGNKGNPFGQTSVLYGAGSSAYSLTVTPTYTWGRYFLRGEYSHVKLLDFQKAAFGTPGLGFGKAGSKSTQDRYMVETGVTF